MLTEQRKAHKDWVSREGDIEHPTHSETLQKPEQLARIQWLKGECYGTTNILELGCSWGFILNEVNGKTGVDANIENIDMGMRMFPARHFVQADITEHLGFNDNSYKIVMLPDVLEHVPFGKVKGVLTEAMRIASFELLITLPWRKDNECAYCFKHKWIPDNYHVGMLLTWLMTKMNRITVSCDDAFVYIKAVK